MKNHFASSIAFNEVALKPQKHQEQILRVTKRVIDSGFFFLGKETRQLEKNLTRFLGKGYVTTIASCHDALEMALAALEVDPRDEVIFPANALPTAFPVYLSGAKPIPVDVDNNGQLDPDKLAKKISRRTKAVILVHLYGLVGNISKIKQVLRGKNIFLIEDCAQAFGARFLNQPVGTLGDIGCFSFYPTKNLATLGDGGAIWTKDKQLYQYFLKARSYGESKRYWSEFVAGHSQMPEIQAGILNLYFRKITRDIQKRKDLATYYQELFKKEGLETYLRPLRSHQDSTPAPHLLVVEAKKRDALRAYLKNHGIETLVHYPYALRQLPAFKTSGLKSQDYPLTERLTQNIISLPFHTLLSQKEIKQIVKIIKNFYEH